MVSQDSVLTSAYPVDFVPSTTMQHHYTDTVQRTLNQLKAMGTRALGTVTVYSEHPHTAVYRGHVPWSQACEVMGVSQAFFRLNNHERDALDEGREVIWCIAPETEAEWKFIVGDHAPCEACRLSQLHRFEWTLCDAE